MREFVKELQAPQYAELFLLEQAAVVLTHPLMRTGQCRSHLQATGIAGIRVFLHGAHHHGFQLLRDIAAERTDRCRGPIDDLMHELAQVAAFEWTDPGE